MENFINDYGLELTNFLEEINDINWNKRFWFAQNASLAYKLRLLRESITKTDFPDDSNLHEKLELEKNISLLLVDINQIQENMASSDPWFYLEQEFYAKFSRKFPGISRTKLDSIYLPLFNSALKSDLNTLMQIKEKKPKIVHRSFTTMNKSILKTTSLNCLRKSNSFKFDEMKNNLIKSVSSEGSFMTHIEKKALLSIGESLAVLKDNSQTACVDFFSDTTNSNLGKGSSPSCRSFNQRFAIYHKSLKKSNPVEEDESFDDDDEFVLACIESKNHKRPRCFRDSTDSLIYFSKKFAPASNELSVDETFHKEMHKFCNEYGLEFTRSLETLNEALKIQRYWYAQNASLKWKLSALNELQTIKSDKISIVQSIEILSDKVRRINKYLEKNSLFKIESKLNEIFTEIKRKYNFNRDHVVEYFLPLLDEALSIEINELSSQENFGSYFINKRKIPRSLSTEEILKTSSCDNESLLDLALNGVSGVIKNGQITNPNMTDERREHLSSLNEYLQYIREKSRKNQSSE